MQFDMNGSRFLPKFGELPDVRIVQFQTWWTKESIYKEAGLSLTRQRLVFSMRHQDGGGHVGTLTDTAYVKLKAGAGWFGGRGDSPPKPMDMGAAASIRQVAWELTETLKNIGEVT
jgi:hypothetical protein